MTTSTATPGSTTPATTQGIPVAGIIRASSQLQGRDGKESIPRQITAIRDAAARLGLTVIKTYKLIDVSGGDLDRTPEWREVVGLLEGEVIRGVLLDQTDRLLRATEWNFNVYRDLSAHGAKVWTPDGAKDPSDPNDTLLLGVMGLLGGHEKAKLARASWNAREEKRKRGEWAASTKATPTGTAFDKHTKVWSLTPEIEEVRGVFRRFAAGQSLNSICKETGRGKSVVWKWLRDPIYSGWMVRTTKQRGGPKILRPDGRQPRRKAIPREAQEVIRVQVFAVPPVPLDLWEAVQRRLAVGKATYQRRTEKVEGSHDIYPMRGVIFCACGQPIYGNSRKRGDGEKMAIYGCRVRLQGRLDWMERQGLVCDTGLASAEAVHAAILDKLAPKFRSPRYIAELAEATMEADRRRAADGVQGQVAVLQRKLATLEKEKPRLLSLYTRDIIPIEELEAGRRKLDKEIEETREAISALGAPPDNHEQEDALRAIVGGALDLGEVLFAISRRDIHALAAALRVTGSNVHIHIGKGRKAPIEITGIELRIADLSQLTTSATHEIRAEQYAHPCRHPRYGLTL